MKKSSILIALLALTAAPVAASQFQAFDRTAQVAGSELIITGRVLAAWSDWTPDRSAVVTDVEIELDEVWKGIPLSDRIVVRTLGGTVDGVTLEVDGAARFVNGEEVLLFLDEQADGSLTPWGMRFGKYSVVGDGADAFLVGSLPPVVSGAQEYVQISIPLEDLRAEVAAVIEKEELQ